METTAFTKDTRTTRRLALALAAVLLAGATITTGVARPARATLDPPVLHCDTKPANGPIDGFGSAEHAQLEHEVYIPAHEARCPQTAGTVTFTQTPEALAIFRLQSWQAEFVGLNQPLSAAQWAASVDAHHLPLMIDGLVVAANVPCASPTGAPVRLSARTLSLVYLGVVTSWSDPQLVADNLWLSGCSGRISVAAKYGGAWSTAVFKDYLAKGNPVFEHYKQREQLDAWPPTTPISCGGVSEADMVACASAGAVSYVRYATAKAAGLTPVLLTNGDGATPPPAATASDTWPSNCQAAVPPHDPRTATLVGSGLDWSTFSMTNGKGYPLCGMGFVVTRTALPAGTSNAVYENWKDHLRLMWSATQQEALKGYGYAPLPTWLLTMIQRNPILYA